jgi:hypothetical protein
MNDIILYANIYIPNELGYNPNYSEYCKYIIDVQQLGLSCIPYVNIVLENTFSKYIAGSIHLTNKIFQFKCRLFDIDSIELNEIVEKFYKKNFFYVNSYIINDNRKNELKCQISKKENNIIKMILLANNDYYDNKNRYITPNIVNNIDNGKI